MKTPILAAALAAFTLPAVALDLDKMSNAEREAFGDQVRAYLLENPQVIMEAVAVLEERQQAEQANQDFSLVSVNSDDIFEDGYSWVGGNPEGDITLVEFVDYRCGYCRRAHEDVKELISADGNIRLIMKEFPILGEDSLLSSRFAIAVKQLEGAEAYETVHDALITMTSSINQVTLTRLANSLGFDPTQILGHMESEDVTAEIQSTRELAQRLQISGTPTFVLQDQLLRGYVPLEGMQAMVSEKRG